MEHHPILSPSSFPMLEQCPRFERAPDSISLEPRPKDPSYRDHGGLMHRVYEARMRGEETSLENDLTPFEQEGINWAVDYTNFHLILDFPTEIEKRLVLMDDSFNIITFGTGDVLNGPQLFDLKTGDYHAYRPQMDVYALAQMDREGLDEMVVHVLFTRFKKAHELRINRLEAKVRIKAIVEAVLNEESPPRANPYCRWCSKILTCEAVMHLVGLPADTHEISDPQELSDALKRAAILKDWVKRLEEYAKTQAIAGLEIPDYALVSRAGMREIADVKRAYELSGLSPDEFIVLCSLPIGALEDAFVKHHEISKSKAKKLVSQQLGEVIVRRNPTIRLAPTIDQPNSQPTE